MKTTQNGDPRTNILIIYTGGTIGSVHSVEGNLLSPLRPAQKDDFEKQIEGIGKTGIAFDVIGIKPVEPSQFSDEELETDGTIKPLDSSNVEAKHWLAMAAAVEANYAAFDGFVILHGTDTMAYTASALSFLLENLAKPVVITGSQLPIFAARTDAKQNLINALYIAGYRATGLPLVPEVIICFADRVLRGNRTRKVSSTSWAGFDTPNCQHLGEIGEHITINTEFVRPPADNSRHRMRAHTRLMEGILDISVYPGLRPSDLKAILRLDGVKGIVFRGFGSGNAPDNRAFLDAVAEGTKDKTIINVTQCTQGMVEMGLYAASSGLQERGVISGLDMTPEAALAKLMYLLTTQRGPDLQLEMQQSLRGEQSVNLYDVRYGEKGNSKEGLEKAEDQKRPPGPFQKDKLTRAVLRVSGVGVQNVKVGDPIKLRVFIGLVDDSQLTAEIPNSPEYAGEVAASYEGEDKTTLILDITSTLQQVYTKDGSPIYVTLVARDGQKFWYRGLFINLFAKAD
ncbi:MAG TPA: asparaginase [Pyrinomonadaceae bacterium]|nr:asparaginase [Pyrinomonadaceae bacterium]